MSTPVYERDLHKDIDKIETLYEKLESQLKSVKKQIDGNCELIEFSICGIEIDIDYIEGTIRVIA